MKDQICKKCGSINDYTVFRTPANHDEMNCNNCFSFIGYRPQNNPATLYFGKYNGTKIKDMVNPDQSRYLHWLLNSDVKLTEKIRGAIITHLKL